MEFFDTHTHLPDDVTPDYAQDMITEAAAAAVKHLLLAGTSLRDCPQYLELADSMPQVYTCIGIHPEACGDFNAESAIPTLRQWSGKKHVVAIGEVGLDAHYQETGADQQEDCLRAMLHLADECGLPVVIHCREAFQRCYEIVGECLAVDHPIQVHSFADGPREMDLWLKRNAFFSYNGMVTFKKAENIRETLRLVPLERMLLETDAPYLTPVPYRGQPNASKFIPLIAQRIAEERSLTLDQLADITTANARRLFRV